MRDYKGYQRLQHWDYRWNGSYLITICTKNRLPYFGEIIGGEMHLSRVGILAYVFWFEIKNHSKNFEIGEFVVMPNHVHGILTINNRETVGTQNDAGAKETCSDEASRHALILDRKTGEDQTEKLLNESEIESSRHALLFQPPERDLQASSKGSEMSKTIGQMRFQNQGKNSISSIVGGYKSAVTKYANRLELDFGWQNRFYDLIIRDPRSFSSISSYIKNNPKTWLNDEFFSDIVLKDYMAH